MLTPCQPTSGPSATSPGDGIASNGVQRALLAVAYEVIEKRCPLLRCMRPFV
jgi:hypothetical protein